MSLKWSALYGTYNHLVFTEKIQYHHKSMSLNDDQFRQITVRDNASEDGDREDQHKDRQIQDGGQTASCQAALNHGGSD